MYIGPVNGTEKSPLCLPRVDRAEPGTGVEGTPDIFGRAPDKRPRHPPLFPRREEAFPSGEGGRAKGPDG